MSAQDTPRLIAVMGPTGSGKSDLAEALADDLGAQLINADAFMVYRGFDIGTNKPARRAEYALMDHVDPVMGSYGVGEFVVEASAVLERVFDSGRSAVVVGGTGLYVRALFEGYAEMAPEPDPELRASVMRRFEEGGIQGLKQEILRLAPSTEVDWANPVRVRRALEKLLSPSVRVAFRVPPFLRLKVGLEAPSEWLNPRLAARTEAMLDAGWLPEVASLVGNGVPRDAAAMRAIGYSSLARHLAGELSFQNAFEEVVRLTRQYAKRQRSWLRSEPGLLLLSAELGLSDLRRVIHERLET